jgi:hypothetical protein
MIQIRKHHILIISMCVFVILNIIENYFHYNIGVNSENNNFKFKLPTNTDWFRIIFIMILFAYLQGFFTELFSEYY